MSPTCARCGSLYEAHTASLSRCTVCVRFESVRANAGRARRGGGSPGLHFDRHGFAQWFEAQDRRCVYCSIPEDLITHLDARTQVGLTLQRLGVDRVGTGYRLDGIALCCFPCNKARSNTFTADEMMVVGAAVAQVWVSRLAAAGVDWAPTIPAAAHRT